MRTKEISMRVAIATLLLAGAASVLSLGAYAADREMSYDPRAAFAETDTNKDGFIDLGEFHARLVEVFYSVDTDKDGFLIVTEYRVLPLSNDFEEADVNNDGKLSLKEFVRIRYHEFQDADDGQDGVLSVDEVVQAYEGGAQ
jgi:Ca2+-binding EF-hand superfamily protein